MAVFAYKAASRDGAITEGFIDASDEHSAAEKLKNIGVIPVKVSSPGRAGAKSVSRKTSREDLQTFTDELAVLLGAGLTLDRSLVLLSEVSEGKKMKDVIDSLAKSIREGSSFSDALQKHPKVFPRLYINMIRAGESGGVLEPILTKLEEFLDSTRELKENILSASIYPIILLLTGGLSVILILTYVLPNFNTIFEEAGTSLPQSTRTLIAVSNGLKSYWWAAMLTAGLAAVLFMKFIRTEGGMYKWDSFKLFAMRDIIVKLETARFCKTLGTLLKSGVPLLQAIGNSRDVIGNSIISASLSKVSADVREGKGIANSMSELKIFPDLALSMIRVGEETGQLENMLLKVSATYEKTLRTSLKRFVGILEPVLILMMGLVIGFILISVLMAIFSITELPL